MLHSQETPRMELSTGEEQTFSLMIKCKQDKDRAMRVVFGALNEGLGPTGARWHFRMSCTTFYLEVRSLRGFGVKVLF